MRIGHVIYLSSSGCALWSWRDSRYGDLLKTLPDREAEGSPPTDGTASGIPSDVSRTSP